MSDFGSSVIHLLVVSDEKNVRKPRVPVQERSLARISKALAAAESMLEEVGPEKTSIPEIAKIANVPRASIYQYFPDKYALFAHLAELHMKYVAEAISITHSASNCSTWRAFIKEVIKTAADYYNANPVASILLLNEPFSRSDHQAHLAKNEALGLMLRTGIKRNGGLENLPTSPNAATLAVEICFACMKYGYGREGKISEVICEEAARAVIAYLSHWE